MMLTVRVQQSDRCCSETRGHAVLPWHATGERSTVDQQAGTVTMLRGTNA
jgi:hypothetical protein